MKARGSEGKAAATTAAHVLVRVGTREMDAATSSHAFHTRTRRREKTPTTTRRSVVVQSFVHLKHGMYI